MRIHASKKRTDAAGAWKVEAGSGSTVIIAHRSGTDDREKRLVRSL